MGGSIMTARYVKHLLCAQLTDPRSGMTVDVGRMDGEDIQGGENGIEMPSL